MSKMSKNKIVAERLVYYKQYFPDAEIPAEKQDCFALEDGKCTALTGEWCKYEPCGFYKSKQQYKKELLDRFKNRGKKI